MKLERTIGLTGAIAMVVGSVIGMGAFVLIPIICSKAGTAAWLSITIALVMSVLSVFPLIQLSSALPKAGVGFEYGKTFLSPLYGTVFSWWSIWGGAAGFALVAFGLVKSFKAWLPDGFSLHLAALILVALFYLVYQFGVKVLTALQVGMTFVMFLALVLYITAAFITYGGTSTFTLPSDSSFLMAIIVSFNISLGFQIIMEMGEEIKRPEKNIPLALAIGALVVLSLYLLTAIAYTGAVGIENLIHTPDLILTVAPVLPDWAIMFIRVGVVCAGLTCFNGAAIAIPREIYAQSRAEVMPEAFSRIHKNGNPQNAITLFFVLVFALFLTGDVLDRTGVLTYFFGESVIEFYGYMTIMGIMLLTMGICFCAWRLPRTMPEAYQKAYIHFSPAVLHLLIVGATLTSLFLLALVSTKWLIPLLYIFITGTVILLYKIFVPTKRN